MKDRFKKLMENQKKRTAAIICTLSILIVAVVVFIGFELQRNQTLYINNYLERQQLYVDQLTIHLQDYTEQGMSVNVASDRIINEVKTSGDSYWFIADNENLIFVKDKTTTKLYDKTTMSSFLDASHKEGFYIIRQSFISGDSTYILGNCISKNYITENGELFKHNIYIIMPLVFVCAVILSVVTFCILIINRQETKIKNLSMEAIDRNIMIEQLTTRLKKSRLNDLGSDRSQNTGKKEKPIYSKEVLGSLLAKINRENIIPLTIIIIELSAKNKIYPAEEYQRFVKAASAHLNKEHVLAEIIPGIFTVLMFNTSSEHKDEIRKTLVSEWALPLKKMGIKVRMGITCIENYDSNVENVFEIVYREVSGMQAENQIRLTS